LGYAFPTLRKEREGWGTHLFDNRRQFKYHPQSSNSTFPQP
jgi:hypothetical protein